MLQLRGMRYKLGFTYASFSDVAVSRRIRKINMAEQGVIC